MRNLVRLFIATAALWGIAVPVSAQPAPTKIVVTPEARAQISEADKQRASALNAEARALYRDGRYKEAIEKFRRAYEINLSVKLLYTIGVGYKNLQAWRECVNYIEQYLERAPVGPKRDRAEIERKACQGFIKTDQKLMIESEPSPAQVYIDDHSRVQGTTPFQTNLAPGKYKIWVEKKGFDPFEREIQVQEKEPFRLNVTMQRVQNQGWLFIDSSVIDARVYIDGKNVGLTPFLKPLPYGAGQHQIVVERDGYTRFNTQINVQKGKVATVDAHLVRTENFSTWRTGLGWTFNVIGVLAVGGGVTAWQFADQEFNDTDKYKDLALYEKLGYGVGGGLLLVGTSLLIWDKARDEILDEHKNKDYGNPVKTPTAKATPIHFGISPNGVAFGFRF